LPRNKPDEPIYSPPASRAEERGIMDLIKIEWEIIDDLQKKAKECVYDKHRAQYYIALSSHARTLSQLIRAAGVKTKDTQDLALLLKDVTKKVRKFVMGSGRWKRR